jgi:aminopeptidase
MNEYYVKLAKVAINYSVKVKPGDQVVIRAYTTSEELIKAIYVEAVKAGGHPRVLASIPGMRELFYKYANDDQLKFVDPVLKTTYENVNCYIFIKDDYNPYKYQNVPPEKLQMMLKTPEFQELMKIRKEREESGDFRWVILPNPSCEALIQEAKMDSQSYFDFVSSALYLNTDDPTAAWQQMHDKQEEVIKILNECKEIHVVGQDTDIKMSLEGRKWINSDGTHNLPGGEVFTSPVEESVNGRIRFTYPGIFMGKEIEDIYLEVKDGVVVKATANKGEDLLQEILKIDGANMFGEFAIGTNKGISTFTKNMLFDEKMGHCIHMALGRGFAEGNAKNLTCAMHWDILKDMSSADSKVFADGKLIYEAGEWKI